MHWAREQPTSPRVPAGPRSMPRLPRRGLSRARRPRAPKRYLEIDIERLKAGGFITPDEPKSQIADEFRVMKRPIIRNALSASHVDPEPESRHGDELASGRRQDIYGHQPRDQHRDGVRQYRAARRRRRRASFAPECPRLARLPGLLDLLGGRGIDFADAVVKTNIEKLTILPAGSRHRRATELLASEQMASLLRELASRYPDRIIIFDSPPLLATTEARVLATHMGQVVMVVAANSTTQYAVNQALATVENCDIVLMMLNKASKTDVGTYYGYYSDDVPA